ncbi:MAG: ribosomal protection-like ABC-F family protein [Deinococcales bacterium]
MLVGLENVEKFYGSQDVLVGVNLTIQEGERLALVGRNGAGKTTILRLLSGAEKPTNGKVLRAPDLSVRVLAQDPVFPSGQSILEAIESAFVEFDALERQMRQLEPELENPQSLGQYHELEEHYRLRGGYGRAARRDTVLSHLGFLGRESERVDGLSGGERTRLALAQILVAQPELLLLDEPTNHLDIVMLEWLEGFLRGYPGAVLIISHDRAFLDAVATDTALVFNKEVRRYPGNYTAFKKAWLAEREIHERTRINQLRELERLEQSAEKTRQWGHSNEKLAIRARAMAKRAERYAENVLDGLAAEQGAATVSFKTSETGEVVWQGGYLSRQFGSRSLFKGFEATIRKGERIAIIGRNGAGKSTLLKTMLGFEPSDDARGSVRLGSRVKLGYYDQQLRGIDPNSTLFLEIKPFFEKDQEVFDILGAYLFPFSSKDKKISSLSGGERARLALLKLSLLECNFLVLDEPTNHLDMEMLEKLEAALLSFEGTLLMVSHDRRFIENVANQIWIVEDGGVQTYMGGYAYAMEKHRALMQQNAPVPQKREPTRAAAPKKSFNPWKLREELKNLEQEIARLESEQKALLQELAAPKADSSFALLGKRNAQIEALLLEKISRWEEVSGLLEC